MKAEVDKLKQENTEKINMLAKVHSKEIESIKSENLVLRNKMNSKMELSNLKDKEIIKARTQQKERDRLAKRVKSFEEEVADLLKCDQCDRKFRTDINLEGHMNRNHSSNIKDLPKEMSSKIIKENEKLTSLHKRIHLKNIILINWLEKKKILP